MTVPLDDDTVGDVGVAAVGDTVTVSLHDENGNPITRTGRVVKILVAA